MSRGIYRAINITRWSTTTVYQYAFAGKENFEQVIFFTRYSLVVTFLFDLLTSKADEFISVRKFLFVNLMHFLPAVCTMCRLKCLFDHIWYRCDLDL